MITYINFAQNLILIQENIIKACESVGRKPESILLLPITKTQPIEVIDFVIRAGLTSIGENRVQEGIEKKQLIKNPQLKWELVGHLQTNKINLALETFDRIQSVDNEKLLIKIDEAAKKLNRKFPILLQVNAGQDPAKFGVDVDKVDSLLELALNLKNIQLDGLMTIPPLSPDLSVAERTFENLRNIKDRLSKEFDEPLPHLSMGMSNDYIQAIKAGSTIIRIGRSLFTSS